MRRPAESLEGFKQKSAAMGVLQHSLAAGWGLGGLGAGAAGMRQGGPFGGHSPCHRR